MRKPTKPWRNLAMLSLLAFAFMSAGCSENPVEPQVDEKVRAEAEAMDLVETEGCKKAPKNASDKSLGPGECVDFGNGSRLTNYQSSTTIKYSTDDDCNVTDIEMGNGSRCVLQGNGNDVSVTDGPGGNCVFDVSGHNNTVSTDVDGGNVRVVGSNNTINNVDGAQAGTTFDSNNTAPQNGPNTYHSGGETGNTLTGSWNA